MKDKISPIPPNYFKLEKLKKVDIKEKIIDNCGDGVTVNTKAATVMKH